MLDLEQSISEWRKQMLASGIKSPVPLEELENHLREEIERQIESGINVQRAFEYAVEKIGGGKSLENEFKKANSLALERVTSVLMGVFVTIVGLRFSWAMAVQTIGWESLPDKTEVISMYVAAFILLVAMVIFGLILALYGGKNVSWLPNKRKV
jgi:hypothetical protein